MLSCSQWLRKERRSCHGFEPATRRLSPLVKAVEDTDGQTGIDLYEEEKWFEKIKKFMPT